MLVGVNTGHYPELPDMARQLSILGGWPVIRFMDWQQTNVTRPDQARPKRLADLPQPSGAWQYTGGAWAAWRGVPLSLCIDTANQVNARAWVCAPHSFDAAELGRFVEAVVKQARLRPIIEYSNEVWNGGFLQRADLGGWPASLDKYSAGVTALHKAAAGRADVVLAAQSANVWIAEQLAERTRSFDALAIAPYYQPGAVGLALRQATQHATLARKLGVPLWGYEIGHHNDTPQAADYVASRLFVAEAAYYLEALKSAGVELACWYSVASMHRPGHAWGLYRIDGGWAHGTAAGGVVRNFK